MNIQTKLWLSAAVLLASIPVAGAEGMGAYVGVGVGTETNLWTTGNSFKVFGGAKVHEFPISPKAGSIQLAVQGEYVNFGKSTDWLGNSIKAYSVGVDAVGTWVIPRDMVAWTDEKLGVVVKLGGAHVVENWNWNFGGSTTYTYNGLSKGVGVEYRVIPMVGVSAMAEYYPNGYDVIGISGVFHF
jgi:hypothetical protein